MQWMAAAGGIWHREYFRARDGHISGLQLWVVLPPELETGAVQYQLAERDELPDRRWHARPWPASSRAVRSPIRTPYDFNYLDVELPGGTTWVLEPPGDHDVAWAYSYAGVLLVGGEPCPPNHLVVFAQEPGPIAIEAPTGDAGFVVGTARQSPWPVVAARGSMHTSAAALAAGQRRIEELGRELQAQGML